jgi:Domain of unknown function (DUF4184)
MGRRAADRRGATRAEAAPGGVTLRSMPLTLPSHAAAVLPLLRGPGRGLPPLALVVGCTAPDLGYAAAWDARLAHTLPGVALICVPLGLLAYVWAEVLVLPALARVLPVVRGVQLGRFTRTRGLPVDVRGWGGVLVALALGALSHVLWDGFTHAHLWPAHVLYPEVRVAGDVLLADVFQHLSSAAGLVPVAAAMVRAYPRLPAVEPLAPQRFWVYAGAALVGAVLQAFRGVRWLHPGTPPFDVFWAGLWGGMRGLLVVLTVAALLERALARVRRPAPA